MVHNTLAVDERLAEVLAIHFDPQWGAPYWLARARALGVDPRREILDVRDFRCLGTMEPSDLLGGPLSDFVPRSVWERRETLIVAQTGGTMGRPVWTAYSDGEFHEAFVEPFVAAAQHVGFPKGGHWLYAGPTGPHVIGRAADAIARQTGAVASYSVDFDARWAKKLSVGSFAAHRYLAHIVEQALEVIARQDITVLFSTPLVLAALADAMTPDQRNHIRGVHYGGTALSREQLLELQTRAFPNAVHLSGYGNTLFGCCLELSTRPDRELRYYPHGARLVFGVRAGTQSPIDYENGAPRGQVVFSRLDRTMLLINVLERDIGTLVAPPEDAPDGFIGCGLQSPEPQPDASVPAATPIY